jgi:hypothetical protein
MKLREEKRVYVNHMNPNDYWQQFEHYTDDKKNIWK